MITVLDSIKSSKIPSNVGLATGIRLTHQRLWQSLEYQIGVE